MPTISKNYAIPLIVGSQPEECFNKNYSKSTLPVRVAKNIFNMVAEQAWILKVSVQAQAFPWKGLKNITFSGGIVALAVLISKTIIVPPALLVALQVVSIAAMIYSLGSIGFFGWHLVTAFAFKYLGNQLVNISTHWRIDPAINISMMRNVELDLATHEIPAHINVTSQNPTENLLLQWFIEGFGDPDSPDFEDLTFFNILNNTYSASTNPTKDQVDRFQSFKDPNESGGNIKKYSQSLKSLIDKIRTKGASSPYTNIGYLGITRGTDAANQYFNHLETALRYIVFKTQQMNDENAKYQLLTRLAEANNHCANRWPDEIMDIYQSLHLGKSASPLFSLLNQRITQSRALLFLTHARADDSGWVDSANQSNQMQSLAGPLLGLPGTLKMQARWISQGFTILKSFFQDKYTKKTIIAEIQGFLADVNISDEKKKLVYGWFHDQADKTNWKQQRYQTQTAEILANIQPIVDGTHPECAKFPQAKFPQIFAALNDIKTRLVDASTEEINALSDTHANFLVTLLIRICGVSKNGKNPLMIFVDNPRFIEFIQTWLSKKGNPDEFESYLQENAQSLELIFKTDLIETSLRKSGIAEPDVNRIFEDLQNGRDLSVYVGAVVQRKRRDDFLEQLRTEQTIPETFELDDDGMPLYFDGKMIPVMGRIGPLKDQAIEWLLIEQGFLNPVAGL